MVTPPNYTKSPEMARCFECGKVEPLYAVCYLCHANNITVHALLLCRACEPAHNMLHRLAGEPLVWDYVDDWPAR